MNFKNAQVFRLPKNWSVTRENLADHLAEKRFVECGPHEPRSAGWVPPVSENEDVLVHSVAGQWLICLQSAERVLPPAVVKRELDVRCQELTQKQGYAPGRRQKGEIKEQIHSELLPQAFVRYRKTYAWIDPTNGWLVIDSSSTTKAEDFTHALINSMSPMPIGIVRTQQSPAEVMANWLAEGEGSHGFSLDGDCTMRSMDEGARSVTYRNGLEDEQIKEHLGKGLRPEQVSLTFDDRVSFTLTQGLALRKINLLDIVKEQAQDARDNAEMFDATFAIMTGELIKVFDNLIEAHGGLLEEANHDLFEGDAGHREVAEPLAA